MQCLCYVATRAQPPKKFSFSPGLAPKPMLETSDLQIRGRHRNLNARPSLRAVHGRPADMAKTRSPLDPRVSARLLAFTCKRCGSQPVVRRAAQTAAQRVDHNRRGPHAVRENGPALTRRPRAGLGKQGVDANAEVSRCG